MIILSRSDEKHMGSEFDISEWQLHFTSHSSSTHTPLVKGVSRVNSEMYLIMKLSVSTS